MTDPRIALINASFETADTRRNFTRELDASVVEYVACDGDLPDGIDVDGAVVTGSRASVYWDDPWIEATRLWVREAVDDGLPVLGVCWGHQLLADALGGEVRDMDRYEIGYREVRHDGSSGLFAGIDQHFTAFQTHSDEVTEVPAGASVVAESDVSIQAFAGDGYWGVQFHPEYDRSTARMVTEAKEDIDPERKRRALASITDEHVRAAGQSTLVLENFVDRLVHPRPVE